MAKIGIQCRFDLDPTCKDSCSDFLKIGTTSAEVRRTFAQKSGALCRKDFIEMADRIAGRDGVHDRPKVCCHKDATLAKLMSMANRAKPYSKFSGFREDLRTRTDLLAVRPLDIRGIQLRFRFSFAKRALPEMMQRPRFVARSR